MSSLNTTGLHKYLALSISLAAAGILFGKVAFAADPVPAKPGLPEIQRPFGDVPKIANFRIGKNADWVAVTPNAVWVAGNEPFALHHIDPRTNRDTFNIPLPADACAGIIAAFGSLWVPLCGTTREVVRIDIKTRRIVAKISDGPAEEGAITASGDSVWFTSNDSGTLVRLDPATNRVRQRVAIASGSYNPIVYREIVWITSHEHSLVTGVDAHSGNVIGTVPTGPQPRFLAAGAGSLWVLNQGDGSVTRIDPIKRRAVATIALGVPGHGGDIAFGFGKIWVSVIGLPLTVIDPATNRPIMQRVGPGGDALRIGHGSLWLTDYRGGTFSRISSKAVLANRR